MSRLRRMDSGAAPTQYSQLLDCICSWGQAANILELITDWLTDSLPKKVVTLCHAWHLCSLLCLSPEHTSLRLDFLIKLMITAGSGDPEPPLRYTALSLLLHSSTMTASNFWPLSHKVCVISCLFVVSLCSSSFIFYFLSWQIAVLPRFNFLSRVFFLPTVTKCLLTALLGSLCTIVEIGTQK